MALRPGRCPLGTGDLVHSPAACGAYFPPGWRGGTLSFRRAGLPGRRICGHRQLAGPSWVRGEGVAAHLPRTCHLPPKCQPRSLLAPPAAVLLTQQSITRWGRQRTARTWAYGYSPAHRHDDPVASKLCHGAPSTPPTTPCPPRASQVGARDPEQHSPPPAPPPSPCSPTARKHSWFRVLGCRFKARGEPGQEVGVGTQAPAPLSSPSPSVGAGSGANRSPAGSQCGGCAGATDTSGVSPTQDPEGLPPPAHPHHPMEPADPRGHPAAGIRTGPRPGGWAQPRDSPNPQQLEFLPHEFCKKTQPCWAPGVPPSALENLWAPGASGDWRSSWKRTTELHHPWPSRAWPSDPPPSPRGPRTKGRPGRRPPRQKEMGSKGSLIRSLIQKQLLRRRVDAETGRDSAVSTTR